MSVRAMIISGGTAADGLASGFFCEEKPDIVVAADRGLEVCARCGIRPTYIVGDFDSIQQDVIRKYREDGSIPIDTYNPVKDYTDTDIAVRKALDLGATELWLFGATGTRLDHTMSNIFNLYRLNRKELDAYIVDEHNKIYMPVRKEIRIQRDRQYGRYVSLFAYGGVVRGVSMTGFRYPVSGGTIGLGDGGLYVSNEITAEEGRITFESGTMIVVESRD